MRKIALGLLVALTFPMAAAQVQDLKSFCEQNDAQACFTLGERTEPTDKQLAFWAFDKGCSLNMAKACYRAAFVFKWNFEKDAITPAKARMYLRKSCKLKYGRACYDLDEIWRFGDPY